MSDRQRVPVIGLIGGIGSGKSAVADWVSQRRRVIRIDGDLEGHRALQQTEIKNKLKERFGNEILDSSGQVDRAILAGKVFGPLPEHEQARTDLENIVHPEIEKAIRKQIEIANQSKSTEAILLDAAILLEAGWEKSCDAVVFIDTPESERVRRVRENRGWDAEELHKREANQYPLDLKRQRADFIISNSASIEEAGMQLEQIIQQFNRPQSSSCR